MTAGYTEAAALAREAIQNLRKKYPPTNPLVVRTNISLGDALRGLGR
ncbi:MAG TPA: hypothetical protein VJO33_17585 [Gemmatimonadaceae bacterium]|nr:hypothetical protein [Gemmatimonadaceae bacterium]